MQVLEQIHDEITSKGGKVRPYNEGQSKGPKEYRRHSKTGV